MIGVQEKIVGWALALVGLMFVAAVLTQSGVLGWTVLGVFLILIPVLAVASEADAWLRKRARTQKRGGGTS